MNIRRYLIVTGVSMLGLAPNLAVAGLSFGIGALGGVNLGNADVEGHSNSETRTGMAMGLRTEFGVTNPISLLIEPTYVQKGALFDYNFGLLGKIKARGELDYIEIPVLIKAKFGALKAHAFGFVGPSLAINTSAKGSIGSYSDEFKQQAAKTVISGDIGGGGAFQVQQYVYLSVEARYSHGFTDALKKSVGDIDSWKSRDVRLMVGLLIHLTE